MTLEDKQLLIKDLCARLHYGVKVHIETLPNTPHILDEFILWVFRTKDDEIVKPYLRSMSSMTEEELKKLNDKYGGIAYFFIQDPPYYHGLQAQHSDIGPIEISEFSEIYDWLDAHYFDYRELIPKGLAIEAKEGMYKTE